MTVPEEQLARGVEAARRYARATAQLDSARNELAGCVKELAAASGCGARPLARALGLPLHLVAGIVHDRAPRPSSDAPAHAGEGAPPVQSRGQALAPAQAPGDAHGEQLPLAWG